MPDEAEAWLREAFLDCVRAARCGLCTRRLDDEAVWITGTVFCPDCGRAHGDPWAPRAHATWRPEIARLVAETDR
jgi:hypothetical protein